jgi:hypothetical protein
MKGYPGPELEDRETALILGTSPLAEPGTRTSIIEVDGKKLPFSANKVKVPPGQRTVWISVSKCLVIFDCTYMALYALAFETEAGHKYRASAQAKTGGWYVWVEDMHSGKVVAGENPP